MNNIRKFFTIFLLVILLSSIVKVMPTKAQTAPITADQLITLVNNWRVGYGHAPLIVDPILMTTAYDTAAYMAINGLRWHIGDVSNRIQAYGYGGGAKVFATENFAIGPVSIETIAEWWSDESHQYPSANPSYVHIGAGVYQYGDRIWYIVHAAYTTDTTYNYTPNPTLTINTRTPSVSQLIIPVQTATPDENGAIVHEVQPGQALWSIAIAYDTKIEDLVRLNNLNPNNPTIYVGNKILVFEGNATPNSTYLTPTSQVTPSPTNTATTRPTRTMTASPSPTRLTIQASTTPNPVETEEILPATNNLFQNRTIGIVLISVLALGILLILTGSFGNDPIPKQEKKEGD
jgi:uncharacterized protein YkwD